MPDTGNKAPSEQGTRTGRGLKFLVTVLALALTPLLFYAFYIFNQLEQVREHQLRRLDSAARAAEDLLANARINVESLGSHSNTGYACDFFERQARLRLDAGVRCNQLPSSGEVDTVLEQAQGRLWFVARSRNAEPQELFRVEVLLHVLLEENPFGDAFEQLFFVNGEGARIGEAVTPRRSSPMLPPRVAVPATPTPVRTPDLAMLPLAASEDNGATTFADWPHVTLAQPVALAGKRYTLMCHPWSADLLEADRARMWLCALTDAGRSLRQALQVSPELLVLMLVLLTVAVLNWPILKVLSLAPQERIRFVDLYMNVLATLALVMLLTVGVAYVGTASALEGRSTKRLHALAAGIDASLRAELRDMYLELQRYDAGVEEQIRPQAPATLPSPALIGCLLLPPEERVERGECEGETSSLLTLPEAETYRHLQLVFWMQPCSGEQTIKGATRPHNTPAVSLNEREYFRAVTRGGLWPVAALGLPEALGEGFYVETSASITTGEFFAALAMPSRLTRAHFATSTGAFVEAPAEAPLEDADEAPRGETAEGSNEEVCALGEDRDRYAAAMTGQPISVRYPVLAPGVSFAVADPGGKVLFHSDERRAVFENLLEDDGVARRLRAALATRAEADFVAAYRTRPHQVHVRPMAGLPWSVVTFADREVLRTFWAELLTRTGLLLAAFLAAAFLGTCLYMLFHGRQPPIWMWPRRDAKYRPIYLVTIASLAVQLAGFVLALAWLAGDFLVLACLLLPLPALGTVVVAGRAAAQLDAAARAPCDPAAEAGSRRRAHLLRSSLLVLLSMFLLLALLLAMIRLDAVAAAEVPARTGGAIALAVAMVAVAALAAAGVLLPSRWLRVSHGDGKVEPPLAPSRPHVESGRGAAGSTEPVSQAPSRVAAERTGPTWSRFWRHPLTPHITGTMLFWILIGALPAYGLFKLALARELTVLAKAEQTYTAHALAWNTCRMQRDLRVLPGSEAVSTDALDGYGSGWSTIVSSTAASRPYVGLYPEAVLSPVVPQMASEARSEHDRSVTGPVWARLARYAPIYNETTTHTRYLGALVAADAPNGHGRWTWLLPVSAEAPVLAYERAVLDDCDRSVPAQLLNRPALAGPSIGSVGALTAGFALALLLAWVTYAARKLFFGAIADDAAAGEADSAARAELALEPHLGELDERPHRAWARAEIAPVEAAVSIPDLEYWCDTCATRRSVLERILEKAQSHYEALWKARTEEEKLLLVQLVEEGFANPKQEEVVRALLRAGLLRRDPILRPMNHSFAVFVERQATPELMRQEHVHKGLRWSLVRNVLLGALVLVFVFLAATQRDAMQVWIASLGAAAAGVTGVLKLMSVMSRASLQKNVE